MFDVGFGELLLIAVVALVVLGPERLPKAARFAGLWVRRARAQWYSVKAELERELEAEELKRGMQETRSTFEQAQSRVREEVGSAQTALRDGVDAAGKQWDQVRREATAMPVEAAQSPAAEANETPTADGANPPVADATDLPVADAARSTPPSEENDGPARP